MFPLLPSVTLAAILLTSTGVAAAPALWKISDENSSIWIFGSIHALPTGTDWRTKKFDSLFEAADRIYFETDVSADALPNTFVLAMTNGFANDGRLLSERVDAEVMADLRSLAEQYRLPIPTLLAMRPWMAANTLGTAATEEAGFVRENGVEMTLLREIPRERWSFLETIEQQINVVAGGSEAEQLKMLTATLSEIPTLGLKMDKMLASWLEGSADQLASLFLPDVEAYSEAFVDRMIIQRNRNWTVQIKSMLASDENAFLVVGAGHMVGEDSVITMLENAGFSSERVQ
ncbi:TraB/GumN family protein [Devosia sp. Leaf64]|uniref:TraB/GumN family protein n=1 Tax=Devosia sp. Leaf64 TaxID=1736229 RepID=UPI000713552B|nr:TraB/GumN family protein [Devosia sp. Leaf64]KQN72697.1 hypothetical protein ASE94_09420 [Devosia sp. Leaf64]